VLIKQLKDSKSTFTFNGVPIDTEYAKYVIEYLETPKHNDDKKRPTSTT